MGKFLIAVAGLAAISVVLASCGSSNNQSSPQIPVRAFVSNPLAATGTGSHVAVLDVINAETDKLVTTVSLALTVSDVGLMAISPNQKHTVVFSPATNQIAIIDNTTNAVSQGPIAIPGRTESMVVSEDSSTAFIAIPDAIVAGSASGVVAVVDIASGRVTASVAIPGAHYMVQSHDGDRLLVFGDNSSTVSVLDTTHVSSSTPPVTPVAGFDHPVSAVFSFDDTKAYIMECGPECAGATAAVTVLDIPTTTVGTRLPLANAGATVGLLSNTTLYVAGTPPGTACGSGTAASTCGTLTVIDSRSMTITNSSPILITDGFHNRIEAASLGQNLFIGARDCTNINIPASGSNPGEVRGCLSIFSTSGSSVTVPPDNGDVTGIQPISNRSVVYVCEGGELRIYDTTTGLLQDTQIDIVGDAVDVKLID